jgi:hypothetical protein
VEKPTSSGAVAAAYVLAAFALIGWLILLPGLASLDSSDAAGNGKAQAFAALEAIALWLLLAILTLLRLAKGRAAAALSGRRPPPDRERPRPFLGASTPL